MSSNQQLITIDRLASVLALMIAAGCARPAQLPEVTPASPAGVQPSQWRVIWTESPQDRALVSWSTLEPGSEHRVYYDTQARGGKVDQYAHRAECRVNGGFTVKEGQLHYHHASLTDLQPSTTYWFTMASDAAVSRELHFRTAPADDRPFAILHGGDSRSDRRARQAMNQFIAHLTETDHELLAFAHGGDYVVTGTSMALWSNWMTDHELTTAPSGRVLPIIPARGNHEASGPQYDEVFSAPGGGLDKNYYRTLLAPGVLFITLNSETAAGGLQRAFLKQTLTDHAKVRWQLAQYHSPIWPAVKVPSGAKTHWVRLFERHQLDLVCEADGHTLKRTVPIRNEMHDPAGVVYIGEGGLGVAQRVPARKRWYLRAPGLADSTLHVWRLRFSPEQLEMKALLRDGTVRDRHVLKPRKR